MHIGLSIPLPAYTIDPAFMAKTAEALGYSSVFYFSRAFRKAFGRSPQDWIRQHKQ